MPFLLLLLLLLLLFVPSPYGEVTRRLRRIDRPFWRVEVVMQGAYQG